MSWRKAKIGEIAEVKGGKRLPPGFDVQDEPTQHPYLRVVDFTENGVNTSTVKFISKEAHERIKRYTISDHDVYVSIAGTIGRVGMVPGELSGANLTENAAKITNLSEIILPEFLLSFLRSTVGQQTMKSAAGGTSQPKLALFKIADIEVPVPDLPTQQRIAEILSAYDGLIENNRRRIGLLEKAARLLYREWFVHLRFPGHETAKMVDGLPEGWELLPASDAMHINPRTTWKASESKLITMVPMGALSTSGMNCDPSLFERREQPAGVKFMNGDTLFARITPCLENGKTGFVNFLQEGEVACGSTEFVVFRERRISRFMAYLLSREEGFRKNAITSMVGSSGRQRVQPSCFDKYLVPVPPKTVVEDFDRVIEPMFRVIENIDKATIKLTRARDLLLPRLMDGRIPV